MAARSKGSITVDLATLKPFPGNAKRHDDALLQESMTDLDQYRPIVVARSDDPAWDGVILAGNGTADAAHALGRKKIDVTFVDGDEAKFRKINLMDNRSNDKGWMHDESLLVLLTNAGLPDLRATGYTEDDLAALLASGDGPPSDPPNKLADQFMAPPFTTIDGRSPEWLARKRAWIATGLRSDLGRETNLTITNQQTKDSDYYRKKTVAEARLGRSLTNAEFQAEHYTAPYRDPGSYEATGTSIFDPVLCEIMLRWYSPVGGHVIDPWAGGSTRGLVSTRLGRDYTGIELRAEQVQANVDKAATYFEDGYTGPLPKWITGDASDHLPGLAGVGDMILGCPPYFDLESYSDDPADLSNLSEKDFVNVYAQHLALAYEALKPNRFAVLVVGSVRDKKGRLRDLRSVTVVAAEQAGFTLHNDAIILTPFGSVAARAGRAFKASRVLSRVHQDVLVFVKGSRKAATQAVGDVNVDDLMTVALKTVAADDGTSPEQE